MATDAAARVTFVCEQLREDPGSASTVWEDIVAQQCDVRETVLDELFRACAASGKGLPGAAEAAAEAAPAEE